VDVLADPGTARALIGLAGQYAAVDEGLTGMGNLVLVGRLNHLRRAQRRPRAVELLEQFDLAEATGRTLKTYSGGMRRRLDLAAALVARPPVLFLDEPTTGLDPRSRIDLWSVIAGLVADGTTLLLSTQYLEEADRLADRICVIDHRRVIAEGTSAELKGRLGGTAVEVVLPDDATAERAAAALEGVGDDRAVLDGLTVRVATTTGLATTFEVVRRLEVAALEVSSLQLRQPSLDEVFLALTGQAPTTREEQAPAEHGPPEKGPRRAWPRAPGGPGRRRPVETHQRRRAAERRLGRAVGDAAAMAGRNVRRLLRAPDQVVFTLGSPIMFTLLFLCVRRRDQGAGQHQLRQLPGPGDRRADGDLHVRQQRLRARRGPEQGVRRPAPLAAHGPQRCADRPGGNRHDEQRRRPRHRRRRRAGRGLSSPQRGGAVPRLRRAVGLHPCHVVLFALAGLYASSSQAVNAAAFPVVFPLTFASSAFVPTATMPSWLRAFANHQTVTSVINAVRDLTLGT